MALNPLESTTRVADRVFEAIHDAIMSGQLPAGHRLRIRELSSELGTSVMPVREAIRRLEELGLAEALPYRGAVVKEFTAQDLLDIYSVRRILEVDASVRGALLVGAESIVDLEGEVSAMRAAIKANDVIEYLDRDEAFLGIIYSAAANPVLLEMIRVLWTRCRTYKMVGVQHQLDTGQVSVLFTHQERMIRAVADRDPQRAARITEESLDAATARIREALPRPASGASSEGARPSA